MDMGYTAAIPWDKSKTKNVDGLFHVAAAYRIPGGCWIQRDTWKAVHNSRLGLDALRHPQFPHMMTVGSNFLMSKGVAVFEQRWGDEFDYTENDFLMHESLIKSQIKDGNGSYKYLEIDIPNRRVLAELVNSDNREYWTPATYSHEVITNDWRVDFSAGAGVMCVVNIAQENPLAFKMETYDLPPKTNVAMRRPRVRDCYLIASEDFKVGDTQCQQGVAYRWDSEEMAISSGTENTKLMRVYR